MTPRPDWSTTPTYVSLYQPEANMYGCLPCPKCGSRYRCQFVRSGDLVCCDDCGLEQPGIILDEWSDDLEA